MNLLDLNLEQGEDPMRNTHSARTFVKGVVLGCSFLGLAIAEVSAQPQAGPQQNLGQGQQQRPPAQGNQAQAAQAQGPQQAPPQLQAPFTLTRDEFDLLYAVLGEWEKRSAQIKTAKANFILWMDDPTFKQTKKRQGKVSYKAPDHGLYKVLGEDGEWVDHWVCDGKSIFDFDYTTKKMTQFNLPPELQGQNIAHGPLPFLFAAKKDDLIKRYWMRVIQPPKGKEATEIWIEAYPRMQNERANFMRATIILTRNEMLPYAIELYFPNNGRNVHQFDWKINSGNPLSIFIPNEFEAKLPRGWSKVVEPQNTGGGD